MPSASSESDTTTEPEVGSPFGPRPPPPPRPDPISSRGLLAREIAPAGMPGRVQRATACPPRRRKRAPHPLYRFGTRDTRRRQAEQHRQHFSLHSPLPRRVLPPRRRLAPTTGGMMMDEP